MHHVFIIWPYCLQHCCLIWMIELIHIACLRNEVVILQMNVVILWIYSTNTFVTCGTYVLLAVGGSVEAGVLSFIKLPARTSFLYFLFYLVVIKINFVLKDCIYFYVI